VVISCHWASTIVFSSLIFIKGFTHTLAHMTTQCTAVRLVRFYLIQCIVSVCANTHTHAHIDTKRDTVSRWHILLHVYKRNKHCLSSVSCLMKLYQTSPQTVLQAEITLHFAASFSYHLPACVWMFTFWIA
jgi:hypothetical protein